MAVIALSIEPYAVPTHFPRTMSRELGFSLVDFTRLERTFAALAGTALDPIVLDPATCTAKPIWGLTARDLGERIRELTLEATLRSNVVINAWGAAVTLRHLTHVVTVEIKASRSHRLSVLQKCLRYPSTAVAELELCSEDDLKDTYLSKVMGEERKPSVSTDLTIDAEWVAPETGTNLISRAVIDSRRALTARAKEIVNRRLHALR